MPVTSIVTKPLQTGIGIGRGAFNLSRGLVSFGIKQAGELLQRNEGEQAKPTQAKPTQAAPAYPAEGSVEVAVDEFGAVGSLTDNTGVEPDGTKPPFPGFDKLSGERVMAHVAESTDLPDLQVLLAYEEAHKNRKGVVQAVEARLAALGTPAT
ncbi:MAG: hypothetical protein QOE05_92 [Actinomycetota bacterium]|nr:hypothetical protein [Actinomycetota bacterium]